MLPDAKLAFEIVDGYFASGEPSAITDAWEILKTAVLAQQTTNTQMDAILKEADILRKEHPSKDCRFFAESVFCELSKQHHL